MNAQVTAPSVTPADIEEEIVSEHYFVAGDGVCGAAHKAGDHEVQAFPASLDLLTICVLVLRNGFTVTGESACASPENFDADIGRHIAREHAIDKVWPLLGFRLHDKLSGLGDFTGHDIASAAADGYRAGVANAEPAVRITALDNGNELHRFAGGGAAHYRKQDGLYETIDAPVFSASTLTVAEAMEEVKKLTLGGFNDWELPTLADAQLPIDRTRVGPAADTSIYTDMKTGWYGTVTKMASATVDEDGVPSAVWAVDMSYGSVNDSDSDDRFWWRPVRRVPPAGQ